MLPGSVVRFVSRSPTSEIDRRPADRWDAAEVAEAAESGPSFFPVLDGGMMGA